MTYSFPTRNAAVDYLAKSGWSVRDGYFTKPTMRGDNPNIPMLALCRVTENIVAPEYGKANYFTVDFI